MFASKTSCMISLCLQLPSNLGKTLRFRSHTTKRNSQGDYKILILLFNSCGWEWKGAFPQSLGKGKPKGILKAIHTTQLKRLKDGLREVTASLEPLHNRESNLARGGLSSALTDLLPLIWRKTLGRQHWIIYLLKLSTKICIMWINFHFPSTIYLSCSWAPILFSLDFFKCNLYYFTCCRIDTPLHQWNLFCFCFLLPPTPLFQPISSSWFNAWTTSLQKLFQRELLKPDYYSVIWLK